MSHPMVLLETDKGEILIELYEDKAPKTVANFLSYVDDGHYNGLIFHRVIENFMIQGGGMDAMLRDKETKDPIENEADNGLSNERGTIAMARTMEPHSATAQFFINVRDNKALDHTAKTPDGWGYCVFGKVTEGMEAVDKIRKVQTRRQGWHDDVPKDPIYISRASRFE
ncbi:MAG: peptidylprolyl isomerase [Desulfovibrionaceae bacterium]